MQRFGRYFLLRPVASGGMADVWLGLHKPPLGPPKLVVIKRIVRERVTDQRFIELFVQEGRLSTLLEHPNIVRTIEMGVANGQYFITLEFLRGQTLLGLLTRFAELRRFIPLGAVLRIAADLFGGLGYAHHAKDRFGQPLGLVHRDISPSNLFVTYDGAAKVLDFGIARAEKAAAGRAPVKGKLPYVSPEQARAQPVDGRSDVFALGVVLHELLTLRPLFRGANDIDTIRRVVDGPIPPPSKHRPNLPKEVDTLILSLLERDPARRPQTAGELVPRIDELAARLGVPYSGGDLKETLRQSFPDDFAAAAALSPELVAAADPRQVAVLAKKPAPRPDKRRSRTGRSRTGRSKVSRVTPAPA